MARKEFSKTLSELESEDVSLETTVPTDATLSPLSDEATGRRKITKQMLDKKQLLHDIQVLKVELSQKNIVIDNLKAEHSTRVEELEDHLSDISRQKQILQVKLESELSIQREEALRKQAQIRTELEEILKRQKHLEETNAKLQERAGDIRKTLKNLECTESQYFELKNLEEDQLSLRDLLAVKIFDSLRPWRSEVLRLQKLVEALEEEISSSQRLFLNCEEKLRLEKNEHLELRTQHQNILVEFAEVKLRNQQQDYKKENYDRIKSERDDFEQKLLEITKVWQHIEIANQALSAERDDLKSELGSLKQKVILLQHDKDYFSKQITDLTSRSTFTEERLQQALGQLETAKHSREELYEKYIISRDKYKSEYELRLREELDQLRLKTTAELEQLRTSSKELYERENRSLRESRALSQTEKERAENMLQDIQMKYEQLLTEYRKQQSAGDSRLAEFQGELKVKTFEVERAELVHSETVKNLNENQLENERLQKKLEVLTREFYIMQNNLEKKLSEVNAILEDKTTKLETYERLEVELDNIVMQAAQAPDDSEAERVLFSYGWGANLPSTAKRRLQQSVQLASKVLRLEHQNTSLTKELEKEKKRISQLSDELSNSNKLINEAQQPYTYLVESLRLRDDRIHKLENIIETLKKDLQEVQKRHSDLIKVKNQLALDLERLLNQREEMALIKKTLMDISSTMPHNVHHSPEQSKSSQSSFAPEPMTFTKRKS